jgi:hypothetical protein
MDLTRAALPAAIACLLAVKGAPAELSSARELQQATGIEAGLAVVLGIVDGRLEAALAADGKMLVQGLTTDAGDCTQAREYLFDQHVYGLASVDHVGTLRTLPYYDMLVNLLVADLDALGDDAPSLDADDRRQGCVQRRDAVGSQSDFASATAAGTGMGRRGTRMPVPVYARVGEQAVGGPGVLEVGH